MLTGKRCAITCTLGLMMVSVHKGATVDQFKYMALTWHSAALKQLPYVSALTASNTGHLHIQQGIQLTRYYNKFTQHLCHRYKAQSATKLWSPFKFSQL
jgi:hypothetical protein